MRETQGPHHTYLIFKFQQIASKFYLVSNNESNNANWTSRMANLKTGGHFLKSSTDLDREIQGRGWLLCHLRYRSACVINLCCRLAFSEFSLASIERKDK